MDRNPKVQDSEKVTLRRLFIYSATRGYGYREICLSGRVSAQWQHNDRARHMDTDTSVKQGGGWPCNFSTWSEWSEWFGGAWI